MTDGHGAHDHRLVAGDGAERDDRGRRGQRGVGVAVLTGRYPHRDRLVRVVGGKGVAGGVRIGDGHAIAQPLIGQLLRGGIPGACVDTDGVPDLKGARQGHVIGRGEAGGDDRNGH